MVTGVSGSTAPVCGVLEGRTSPEFPDDFTEYPSGIPVTDTVYRSPAGTEAK
jgi:hypothetical protein